MDNLDLKIIKKKYGEKMSHLCRDLFPAILENPGVLSKFLFDNFEPSKFLYDDIIIEEKIDDFKNFVYSELYKDKEDEDFIFIDHPSKLMSDAGYELFECNSEEDIQKFKKYYASGEELCTFRGGRLGRCHVFFAVKKNIDDIKRENFKNPLRQDLYGTSVISIQFSRDSNHTLSIKNRYNHSVNNPDSTFSNDLDNIIAGLTNSFSQHYGLKQNIKACSFELDNYTRDKSGKFIRYNMELDGIYYCPGNIIVNYDGTITNLSHEKYLLIDYFIIDLVNKKIILNKDIDDESFQNSLKDMKKIEILNDGDGKIINFILSSGEVAILKIDKYNRIISYENPLLKDCDLLLNYNNTLKYIVFPGYLKSIDTDNFCEKSLESIKFQEGITSIGESVFFSNKLNNISLPESLTYIGESAFEKNDLISISLPSNLKVIDEYAFAKNKLTEIVLPDGLIKLREGAFYGNLLESICIPDNIESIGKMCFEGNKLRNIIFSNSLNNIGNRAFKDNDLSNIYLPDSIKKIGNSAFEQNNIEKLYLPDCIKELGENSFKHNKIKEVVLPKKLKKIDSGAFYWNKLCRIDIPENVEKIEEDAFNNNEISEIVFSKNLKIIEAGAFARNKLRNIILPDSIEKIEEDAFVDNMLTTVVVPDNAIIEDRAFDEGVKIVRKSELKKGVLEVEKGNHR